MGETAGEVAAGHAIDILADRRHAVVAAYWSMDEEFPTLPLLHALHDRGFPVVLPVVVAPRRPLEFRRWVPGLAMEASVHDIPVPPRNSAVMTPEALIVPLLAYDGAGYRLGYGGGFYDMTLAALRAAASAPAVIAAGLAFSGQEIGSLPHEDFDETLDLVITETGIVRPNR